MGTRRVSRAGYVTGRRVRGSERGEMKRKRVTGARSKMGPSGDPGATRAALLEAAQRAFEEAGFDGTDTNRIARAAGYSPQTFYRHFPDKLAIFVAVYERWVESHMAASFAAQGPSEAAQVALREHAAARIFRRDLRALSLTDPRVRAVRARERQRQLEALRARFPVARELPLAQLATWLLCAERIADAIVEHELADLGLTKAEAEAQLARMVGMLRPGGAESGPQGLPPLARRQTSS